MLGPIVGAAIVVIIKNVVSAWIERWNLVLGLIFVVIITFMPEGLVPGIKRLWGLARGDKGNGAASEAKSSQPKSRQEKLGSARHELRARGPRPAKSVRWPQGHAGRQPRRRARRTPADHRSQRCRQDDAVQPDHRRDRAGRRIDPSAGTGHHEGRVAAAHPHAAWRAPTRSSRCSPRDTIVRNVTLALLGLSPLRWNPFIDLEAAAASRRRARTRRSTWSAWRTSPNVRWRRPPTASGGASRSRWRWRKTRTCCCSTSPSPGFRSTSGRT